MICDGQTDRRMDGRMDGHTGKNNMSPDPAGGDIIEKKYITPDSPKNESGLTQLIIGKSIHH